MIGVNRPNHDYYVRMSLEAVNGIGLEHHATEITCAPVFSGFTEWVAQCETALLVVSWDWTRLDDGIIVQPHPRMVLSNLMLLNDYAFDQGVDATEAALMRLVDRLDWKPAVARTCDCLMARMPAPAV
ncbi:DUF4902 domain-containing protein [Acidovorax sp. LjRoot194]|uniref:DUF4902 domain-containing protein n=1 Tax=Acidovorax sp. LjRoot194 TaxID=3342280 RepID=UPI003ECCF993